MHDTSATRQDVAKPAMNTKLRDWGSKRAEHSYVFTPRDEAASAESTPALTSGIRYRERINRGRLVLGAMGRQRLPS